MNRLAAYLALLPPILIAGCAEGKVKPGAETANSPPSFWPALASHCGKAFAGKLVSNDAADADFRDAAMIMHVRECEPGRIAVPFHVQRDGKWDRSRTWVFTARSTSTRDGRQLLESGLSLEHDHRHEDGQPDAVTMYGGYHVRAHGETTPPPLPRSVDFPVNQSSIALFEREGLSASVTNVWTVEVDPAGTADGKFVYQLKRTKRDGAPEDRFFRVEFDLTKPVDPPPAPWGFED